MSDELNGQETIVEEKPQETMPVSEKPVETKVEEQDLPEDSSDRTKEQFEKLKQSNKELAERLRQLEVPQTKPQESALDSLTPKTEVPDSSAYNNLSQGDIDKQFDSLVDANGYVDLALLKKTLAEANKQAQEASLNAKQALTSLQELTQNEQTRQAHHKYPELDPTSEKFDERFYSLVKNELIGQMMKGEKNFVKAADEVSKWYSPSAISKQAEEQKAKDSLTKEQQVRQINATGTGASSKVYSNKEDLMTAVRQGKPGALAEALK